MTRCGYVSGTGVRCVLDEGHWGDHVIPGPRVKQGDFGQAMNSLGLLLAWALFLPMILVYMALVLVLRVVFGLVGMGVIVWKGVRHG